MNCMCKLYKNTYKDDTGRFPIRARGGNQYFMVAYHSSNVILVEPFFSRKDKYRLEAYNTIMQRLELKDILVDLHILDNECSKEYQATIRTGGKFSSNSSLLTCIGEMQLSEQLEHLKLTS